jgi:hypothetical protein
MNTVPTTTIQTKNFIENGTDKEPRESGAFLNYLESITIPIFIIK